MIRFGKYLQEAYLEESLNTPVEFYLTDDTKMPREIYAAFEVSGSPYGISLIKTKYDKVYMLDLYRIVNVKKRSWSFLSSKHIRPALSTVLKFMEASFPFIQQHLDGVIINIPGKTGSEKYAKFLEKVIRRSYIKKFRSVPIVKTTDKANNYVFMIKKGKDPTSLFKTATFWKNFKFDSDAKDYAEYASQLDTLDSDIMNAAADPYKKIKNTVSVTPSKKFAFGKVEMEVTAGPDLIDQLENASPAVKAKSVSLQDSMVKKGYSNLIAFTPSLSYTKDSIAYPLSAIMSKAVSIVSKNGFDESKFVFDNFKYAFKEGYAKQPKEIQANLELLGFADSSGNWLKGDDDAKNFLKYIEGIHSNPDTKKAFEDGLTNYVIYANSLREAEQELKTGGDDKQLTVLDWGVQPTVESPKMEAFNALGPNDRFGMYGTQGSTFIQALEYLMEENPEIKKWYDSPPNQGSAEFDAMKGYTGKSYTEMNSNMRDIIKAFREGEEFNFKNISQKNIDAIHFFLKNPPRLSKPMWVIRNMDLPFDLMKDLKVGGEFVDTAFLSTTIHPNVTMGYSNGRMKIYLPAGTPVFPALEKYSINDSEKELTLPPASVMKITKSYEYSQSAVRMFEAVYIGNGLKDMYERLKSGKGIITEQAKGTGMKNDYFNSLPKTEQESLSKKYAMPENEHDSLSKKDMDNFLKMMKKGLIKLDTQS